LFLKNKRKKEAKNRLKKGKKEGRSSDNKKTVDFFKEFCYKTVGINPKITAIKQR
jgi:hypothetical protein